MPANRPPRTTYSRAVHRGGEVDQLARQDAGKLCLAFARAGELERQIQERALRHRQLGDGRVARQRAEPASLVEGFANSAEPVDEMVSGRFASAPDATL